MSREAFEKWWDGYDLTKNNTVSSTTVLELLYDAWQARGEHDANSFNAVCNKICKELPEGFLIKIELENGSGNVSLTNNDWNENYIELDESTMEDKVLDALRKSNPRGGCMSEAEYQSQPYEGTENDTFVIGRIKKKKVLSKRKAKRRNWFIANSKKLSA